MKGLFVAFTAILCLAVAEEYYTFQNRQATTKKKYLGADLKFHCMKKCFNLEWKITNRKMEDDIEFVNLANKDNGKVLDITSGCRGSKVTLQTQSSENNQDSQLFAFLPNGTVFSACRPGIGVDAFHYQRLVLWKNQLRKVNDGRHTGNKDLFFDLVKVEN